MPSPQASSPGGSVLSSYSGPSTVCRSHSQFHSMPSPQASSPGGSVLSSYSGPSTVCRAVSTPDGTASPPTLLSVSSRTWTLNVQWGGGRGPAHVPCDLCQKEI